jgi:uncharacterized protein
MMNKTAVVTGATSGIGAAYAKKLASRGYDLILTGRRQEIIRKLAEELEKQFKIKTEVIIAELSLDADIQKVANAIKSCETLEILVNNAGYIMPALFDEKELAAIETMMKVLMTAPTRLVYAVLPNMIKNGKGTIINVSSLAAFLPLPKMSPYASCKSFIKTFSERLQFEMKDKGIKVQAVCPGIIDTDFYRFAPPIKKAMAEQFPMMSPESVVDCSLEELTSIHVVCIPGVPYKAMAQKVTAALSQELT